MLSEKLRDCFIMMHSFRLKTTNRVLTSLKSIGYTFLRHCLKHLVKQPFDSEDHTTTATKSLTRFIRHFHEHFRLDRFHVTQNLSKSKIILRRSRSSSTR